MIRQKWCIVQPTSKVLLKYGVSNKSIHINQSIVRKIVYPAGYKIGNDIVNQTLYKTQGDLSGKHNLGMSAVKNLPLQISDPIAITKNNATNANKNSVVLWTNWITKDGEGIMIGFVIDGKTGTQNNISTVFPADDDYAKTFFANEGDILYTKNNEDIEQLLSKRRYMPEAMVDDVFIKNLTQKFSGVNYSDRINTSVYDIMGQGEDLQKQNAKLEEDVARLKERLKLERQVTKGNTFNEKQLGAVARHS